MSTQYTLAIFEPDHCDTSCVIMYYCCLHYGPFNDCNESTWIVPGTLNALINYFENGGTITVCKPGRRNTANTSFPAVKGTIAHAGAKSINLRNSGVKGKNK